MIQFAAWPKTPRLFRDMVITEKIDGTNAAVIIEKLEYNEDGFGPTIVVDSADPNFGMRVGGRSGARFIETAEGEMYAVGAQSRSKLITPGKTTDNHGFAGWVYDNAADLVRILGPGRHFGEWWGSGINRGYGLTGGEKRFSLFNVNRYAAIHDESLGLSTVPVLAQGPFDLEDVRYVVRDLADHGSLAAPGFMRPEGVIVYHTAARQTFKVTVDNDEAPKGMVP